MNKQEVGHIAQIIGPVIDVVFDNENDLPNLYDALEITREGGEKLILEAQQAIGENTIRTIAMDSSDGLSRGMEVFPLGHPISMPVSEDIKGRLFNVVLEFFNSFSNLFISNFNLFPFCFIFFISFCFVIIFFANTCNVLLPIFTRLWLISIQVEFS
ncbi:MAG TPA: hypothetical protein EYP80_02970 [Candidatus Aenigmarchaeota archaeon]|nr:hypothetical protein [Candidatus Aenigmarchaeota archaeon]